MEKNDKEGENLIEILVNGYLHFYIRYPAQLGPRDRNYEAPRWI